jgi:hypothetical protein
LDCPAAANPLRRLTRPAREAPCQLLVEDADEDAADDSSACFDVSSSLRRQRRVSSGCAGQQANTLVCISSLEPAESLAIVVDERALHVAAMGDLIRPLPGSGGSLLVQAGCAVQYVDEPLIRVVALALRRDAAEHPRGDRERESQEQQARGEPQPAAGYFLSPLWPLPPLLPLPPPWSAGGPPPLAFGGAAGAFGGAAGAFLACPGGVFC